MPIQGLRFTIPTTTEKHLSFQSTGSFTAYNPNDGVANVALDRTATSSDYDHKLPSQSGGKFPGPINSYLSIYYADQSGAATTGEIIVYASPEVVNIPYFWSIGRALQVAGSTMDITSGSQPQNPPASTVRLWVDGNNALHILDSTGIDRTVYDTTNIGTATLGGDLYGTISAGHIGVRQGDYIGFYDTTPTLRKILQIDGANNTIHSPASASPMYWQNFGNTANNMSLDNVGNLNVTANLHAAGAITGQYLHTSDGGNGIVYSDAGSLYLRGSNGSVAIDGAGGIVGMTGPISTPSNITTVGLNVTGANVASGWIYMASYPCFGWNGSTVVVYNGLNVQNGYITASAGGTTSWWYTPTIYLNTTTAAPYIQAAGAAIRYDAAGVHSFESTAGGYQSVNCGTLTCTALTGPTSSAGVQQAWILGTASPGGACIWMPTSTIPSLGANKLNLLSLSDADCLARIVDPRVHAQTWDTPEPPALQENNDPPPLIPYPPSDAPVLTSHPQSIGFIVEEMKDVVPEVVGLADGEPFGIMYPNLTALLWGAVRQLNTRLTTLGG
jgi:hypothetical protein